MTTCAIVSPTASATLARLLAATPLGTLAWDRHEGVVHGAAVYFLGAVQNTKYTTAGEASYRCAENWPVFTCAVHRL
jgi:hypothetical protein